MSLVKVMAVTLAMASGANGSTGQHDESASARMSTGRGGDRDLRFTWWSAMSEPDLLFTWAQPGESRELRLTFWQPAEDRAMLLTFSAPELERDLVLTWSRPDESRALLFTWSNPLPAAEEEGAAGGEPRTR